jgi:hypothetical protein
MLLINGPEDPQRLSLSAAGGGESWGEVGKHNASLADAHRTLPWLRDGALPLLPPGEEGKKAV